MKNEKTWKLLGAVLLVAAALCYSGHIRVVDARLTGTNPNGSSSDTFCVGPKSFEVCADYLGNFIPTTTNTQTLGTSALKWSNIYATTITPTTVTATTVNATTVNATNSVVTGYGELAVMTTTQIAARTDPIGAVVLSASYTAGVADTSRFGLCVSTAPSIASYVYLSTVTTANIGKICN